MATRDNAQLILEVDARIASAQRALNQLARSVQQDSAGMENGLKKIEQSGERLGKSLGSISSRTRSGFTQLSFQIGDVTQGLAMGTKASTIFAQQSGQVIQALQVMGGEGNKFLQFLGGPWGLAISTAVVVLGTLGSKLFESGDEVGKLVDKMRDQAKQAALNKQADEAWKNTIEGLTEAIRKRREEQEKGLQTDIQAEQASLKAARDELTQLKRQRDQAARERSQLSAGNQSSNIIGATEKRIAELQRIIADLDRKITIAEANVRGAEAPIAERAVEGRLDKVKAATDAYTTALGNLRKQLQAGVIDQAKFEAQLEKAAKKRDAAIKAAQATSSTANRQSGRQVSFSEATSIAQAAGFKVNSGFRSVAEQAALFNNPAVNRPGNPVAPPGSSAHNGAKGKWAIDIQITDGVTPAKIRKVFADQGVSLTKVLKEKGHFHIEGSRSEAAAAERQQESAQEKAVRQQNAFEEQNAKLARELLRAKNELLQGVDAQADAAIEEVVATRDARQAAIQNDVEEGKITQANADILKAKVAQIAVEQAKAIELQRSLEHMRQADETEQRRFQYRVDDLRFADEMATTQAEHRRIQLQILDVVYQQKEAHLRALKAELELAGKLEEAAKVQEQIDRLPTEQAQDSERVARGTMNPLEAWAHDIPKTADEINEAFQSIAAEGLEGLSSAIFDVISGTKNLKDAFGDLARSIVADILQMTIKMLIFRAISGAIGGIFGGSGGAGGGFGGGIENDVLFGSGLPRFASGGLLSVGGRGGVDRNLLSINGVPRALVSADETLAILPRAPRVKTGGQSMVRETIVKVIPSPFFETVVDSRVVQTAGPMAGRAAVVGATGGMAGVYRKQGRTLP